MNLNVESPLFVTTTFYIFPPFSVLENGKCINEIMIKPKDMRTRFGGKQGGAERGLVQYRAFSESTVAQRLPIIKAKKANQ